MAALTWGGPFNLRGQAGKDGAQLRYGYGAPTTSNPAIQNDGDSFLDLNTGRLYATRSNGTWPTTYASLACKDGATIRTGTGTPTSGVVANDGDYYFQTDLPTFFGPRQNGTWPSSGVYLQGTAGLGILSGSGAPSSSLGVLGQPGYLDTTNSRLYSAKTSSGWPTSYTSLIGARGSDGNTIRSGTAEPGIEYGNNGDLYIKQITGLPLYVKITYITAETTSDYPNGWKNLGNLVGAKGDTGSTGVQGPSGATIRTGSGAPTSSTTANEGDYYFRTDVPTFYGPRANSAWGTGTSLQGTKGDAGLSVLSGSGAPASSLGVVGQPAYFDTTNYIFYGAKTSNGWPSTGQSLLGLSVLTGSGAPDSSLGVVGQPGYLDLTNFVIYGAKTSSGWPAGASFKGATGPSSPGLRSGSGVPSSTNPSYQVDNDYYLRTDVTPFLLYGPRTNGTWPTTAQNTGGAQTQYGNGPPASTLGAQGDVYYDLQNAFFYPPKQSGGWTLAPLNLVGPTGAAGFTTLSTQSAGNGPSVGMSGVTLSATATAAYIPGSTQANVYPTIGASSELVGYSITNPGAAVTLTLINLSTNATVITLSIAANLTTGASYTLGSYPLAANTTFQWRASGSGTASFCLTPLYLYPAASIGNNVSSLPSVGQSTSTTFSSTATQLKYVGTTTGNAYRMAKSGGLYAANLINASNASLTFTLNISTNAGSSYSTLYSVAVAANTTLPVGPFALGQYAAPAAAFIYWSVAGTGTGTCYADTQILLVG